MESNECITLKSLLLKSKVTVVNIKMVCWELEDLQKDILQSSLEDIFIGLNKYCEMIKEIINCEKSHFYKNIQRLLIIKEFSESITVLEEIIVSLANLKAYIFREEPMIVSSVKMQRLQKDRVKIFINILSSIRKSIVFTLRDQILDHQMESPQEVEEPIEFIYICNRIIVVSRFVMMRLLNCQNYSNEDVRSNRQEYMDWCKDILTKNLCTHPPETERCPSVIPWSKLVKFYKLKKIPICQPEETCTICLCPISQSGTNYVIQNCCYHKFCLLCYEKELFNKLFKRLCCPSCGIIVDCWTTRHHYNTVLQYRRSLLLDITQPTFLQDLSTSLFGLWTYIGSCF